MTSSASDHQPSPLPPSPVPKVLRDFLRTEASGGLVLLVSAGLALVWANSPWRAGYESIWTTELSVRVGGVALADDLRHWVNEALMAVFFLVVGLEIKRELVTGDLRDRRTAALPALAAVGGMAVPAALYAVVNIGGPGGRGWAIPMATDIAFVVGVLALLGSRVPRSLKLFLLTLAVVDDIGAIVVIAAFYSGGVQWPALAVATALVAVTGVLRRAGVRSLAPFALVGVAIWVAVFQSRVHATIAGVVLALLVPARAATPDGVARDWAADLDDDPSPDDLRVMTELARSSLSDAERLLHHLHPLVSFLVLPLFALANAGIRLGPSALTDAGTTRVAVGVLVGLVVGKLLGVAGFTWLAVRLGLGALPGDMRWSQLVAGAALAGIGFTVSLFVTGLAFEPEGLQDAAKLGVLAASVVASCLGGVLLWTIEADPQRASKE